MEDKYNPSRLLPEIATYFESEEKIICEVPNEEIAKYRISVYPKKSMHKFVIMMVNDRIELLRKNAIKNYDELEKNKDELGHVAVFKGRKPLRTYRTYEEFFGDMGF